METATSEPSSERPHVNKFFVGVHPVVREGSGVMNQDNQTGVKYFPRLTEEPLPN